MSSVATIKSNNTTVSGRIVITKYGLKKLLERVHGSSTLNLAQVGIGSKMQLSYNENITELKNEVARFDIPPENIILEDNICTIKSALSLPNGTAMQEIGIYDVVDNRKYLFAYASGFSMVSNDNLSYELIIDLGMYFMFQDTDFSKYDVSIGDLRYGKYPDVEELYNCLSNVHTDLERSIQMNANKLGLNKAEVFYKERRDLSELIQSTLLFGRYQKMIYHFSPNDLADCFYYPETSKMNYLIKNLQDPESSITVHKNLQNANKDNIDLSKPATIICTATLHSLEKPGIIFGKLNPDSDYYYFDFRISSDDLTSEAEEKYLQFTIYSHKAVNTATDFDSQVEFRVVGHYRIKCYLTDVLQSTIIDREASYAFVFNGDEDNPNVDFYINTTKIPVIVDNFNFHMFESGSEQHKLISKFCTLKNYTSFTETIPYETSITYDGSNTETYEEKRYYVLDTVKMSSLLVFNKALTENDIHYLALISQG